MTNPQSTKTTLLLIGCGVNKPGILGTITPSDDDEDDDDDVEEEVGSDDDGTLLLRMYTSLVFNGNEAILSITSVPLTTLPNTV